LALSKLVHLTLSPTNIWTDEGLYAKPAIFTSTIFWVVFCDVATFGVDVGVGVGVFLVLVHPIVKNILSKTTKTMNSLLMVIYCYSVLYKNTLSFSISGLKQ
jgi:hypothetical protein